MVDQCINMLLSILVGCGIGFGALMEENDEQDADIIKGCVHGKIIVAGHTLGTW